MAGRRPEGRAAAASGAGSRESCRSARVLHGTAQTAHLHHTRWQPPLCQPQAERRARPGALHQRAASDGPAGDARSLGWRWRGGWHAPKWPLLLLLRQALLLFLLLPRRRLLLRWLGHMLLQRLLLRLRRQQLLRCLRRLVLVLWKRRRTMPLLVLPLRGQAKGLLQQVWRRALTLLRLLRCYCLPLGW